VNKQTLQQQGVAARAKKSLNNLVRITSGEIITAAEAVDRNLAAGWKPISKTVVDESAMRKLKNDLEASQRRYDDWNVSPMAIAPLKKQIADLQEKIKVGVNKQKYIIESPHGTFRELTKAEYDYATRR
jgi:polyhydroxyalkanoate synthesis regulator phasin